MPSALLVTSIVNTIQIGSLYALMALGITLTFSVVKLPNFAHAEYVTVGAYAALIISLSGEVNPLIIMSAAFVVGALVALVSHLVVFKPLEGRNVSLYTLILSSFAVGLILRYILFRLADYFNLFDTRIRIPLQIILREGSLILTNIFCLGRAHQHCAGDSPDNSAQLYSAGTRDASACQQHRSCSRDRHSGRARQELHLAFGRWAGWRGGRPLGFADSRQSFDGVGAPFWPFSQRPSLGGLSSFSRHYPGRLCSGLFGKHCDAIPECQFWH